MKALGRCYLLSDCIWVGKRTCKDRVHVFGYTIRCCRNTRKGTRSPDFACQFSMHIL
jgi:hypothetical protein